MNLYEVTNGFIGESYVRVYVWCATEEMAYEMAQQAFMQSGECRTGLRVRKLFSANDASFVSVPSDTGFNDEGV